METNELSKPSPQKFRNSEKVIFHELSLVEDDDFLHIEAEINVDSGSHFERLFWSGTGLCADHVACCQASRA